MEALMKQRNEDYVRFSAASDAERQRNAPFYQGSREKKATILAARIASTPGCIPFLEQGQNLFLNNKYTTQRLFEMLEFDLLYVHALLNTFDQQTPESAPIYSVDKL
jgi:hypothetical protein